MSTYMLQVKITVRLFYFSQPRSICFNLDDEFGAGKKLRSKAASHRLLLAKTGRNIH